MKMKQKTKKQMIRDFLNTIKGLEPFYVAVGYSSGQHDDFLIATAKKFSGEETGSGYGFGQRDIGFDFPTKNEAKSFVSAVKRSRKRIKILSTQRLCFDYIYQDIDL